jgi:hypothetical protein
MRQAVRCRGMGAGAQAITSSSNAPAAGTYSRKPFTNMEIILKSTEHEAVALRHDPSASEPE